MQAITITFKTEHTPDDTTHLLRIAQAYFKGKGITLSDDSTIEIWETYYWNYYSPWVWASESSVGGVQ